jgi:hypothetical protein
VRVQLRPCVRSSSCCTRECPAAFGSRGRLFTALRISLRQLGPHSRSPWGKPGRVANRSAHRLP